jgi:hypothetical protein
VGVPFEDLHAVAPAVEAVERGADAPVPDVLVDNLIFDLCLPPGREREGSQGQHADNDVLIVSDEEGGGLVTG